MGVSGSTTVSLSFVCSDGMKHITRLKSGENIRDWAKNGHTTTIDQRLTQNVITWKHGGIDRQGFELPKAFAERTLTSVVLTDSGVTGKAFGDENYNNRVHAQRAFILGLTIETVSDNPKQSPSFDAVAQKLLDETISKLKGAQAKQVA